MQYILQYALQSYPAVLLANLLSGLPQDASGASATQVDKVVCLYLSLGLQFGPRGVGVIPQTLNSKL